MAQQITDMTRLAYWRVQKLILLSQNVFCQISGYVNCGYFMSHIWDVVYTKNIGFHISNVYCKLWIFTNIWVVKGILHVGKGIMCAGIPPLLTNFITTNILCSMFTQSDIFYNFFYISSFFFYKFLHPVYKSKHMSQAL